MSQIIAFIFVVIALIIGIFAGKTVPVYYSIHIQKCQDLCIPNGEAKSITASLNCICNNEAEFDLKKERK
jgi:hypothetical protein